LDQGHPTISHNYMLILDKRQPWQKVIDRTFGIKRSFRLDPHIESVVLALIESGIRTTQSCEGHMTHGFPYPWVRIVNDDRGTLQTFLEAFYKQHPMIYDRMLQIEHLLTDEYMLRSHGAILQESRDPDEQVEKLKEYQQEMHAFALFLKERFSSEQ